MTRLFYSTLYAVTAAAACAIWARHEENPALRDLVGVRRANAQSPDPSNPLNGDPAANPLMNGAGMNGGMNGGMNAMNGMNGAANPANLNSMILSRPEVGKAVSRPDAWPGGPSSPSAPTTSAVPAADGLPGVSISSVPVIPGVGTPYSYNPKLPDGGQSAAATAGRMEFSQPGSGPISASQAAMAATSWSMAKELEGTKILARVGTEYILAADVLGPVNEIMARNADKIPPNQYDTIRENMIKQRLDSLIQTKMVLDVVRRKIPEEGFKKFSEKIGEQFDNVEVPKALVKSDLKTPKELDEDLRKTGSSLEREKRAYIERQMSMIWVHQNVKSDDEVTHEDMVKYYREHEHEYDYPAKVKWEQILVRFDRCPKSEAYRKLAEAGNKIFDGADFAAVAKSVSQGITASTGGVHDWTTKGSLVSEEVDNALFTLPAGKLSPILEDAKSFQIVRVVERKDAGRTPFTEAQGEIKRRLKWERSQVAGQKYVTEIRKQVKVWTIFDEHEADDLVPAKRKPGDSKTPADAAPPNIAGPATAQPPGMAPPSTPPAGMPSTPPAVAVTGSSPQPYPVAGQAAAQASPAAGSGYPTAGPGYPPAGYPATGGGAPPAYPTTSAAPAAGQPGAPRYR